MFCFSSIAVGRDLTVLLSLKVLRSEVMIIVAQLRSGNLLRQNSLMAQLSLVGRIMPTERH